MIKAIIIDDEPSSRELLTNMLLNFIGGIEILGEAHDVTSGVELIKSKEPDLVFLDIEMPGGNGFKILNEFEKFPFKVIFITGYDQYAIKAIRYAALDYILKPIDLEELEAAISRFQSLQVSQSVNLNFLNESTSSENEEAKDCLVIPSSNGYTVLQFNEIMSIEAEGAYVTFHLENDEKRIATYPLNHYEDLLPSNLFFRIHKSYLINCKKVVNIDPGRGGKAHLQDGSSIDIAIRRKSDFIRKFKQFHG